MIAAVAPDLTTLARSLRSADAGLRWIAATERLLTDGTSALYRNDEELLREELRRIRYLLEGSASCTSADTLGLRPGWRTRQ